MATVTDRPRTTHDFIKYAAEPEVTGAELVSLAAHKDARVRAVVAGRADAPMATLISLANDKDGPTRFALVQNPASPLWVLQKLAQDKRGPIRDKAVERLAELGE